MMVIDRFLGSGQAVVNSNQRFRINSQNRPNGVNIMAVNGLSFFSLANTYIICKGSSHTMWYIEMVCKF